MDFNIGDFSWVFLKQILVNTNYESRLVKSVTRKYLILQSFVAIIKFCFPLSRVAIHYV